MERTVRDVMRSGDVSVRGSTPVHDVVDRILSTHLGALPVVDHQGRLLGIVSESDVLLKQEPPRHDGAVTPGDRSSAKARRLKVQATTAAQLMTGGPVSSPAWRPLDELGDALLDHRHLPVVDGLGRVVGVLSRRDLLRTYLRRQRAE